MLRLSISRRVRQLGPLLAGLFCIVFWAAPAMADGSATEELKLFAVEIRVGPGWDAEKAPGDQEFFREHSMHLKKLRDAGHIAMGARYSDVGLLVFSAASEEAVHELMAGDPSMSVGTFRYDVHAMNVFYPWQRKPAAPTIE